MKLMYRFLIVLAFSSSFYITEAQTLKQPPKASAVKTPVDTFSRNIINAIKKVTALAVDPKKSGRDLARKWIGNDFEGNGIFTSAVNLPGSEMVFVKRERTWRSNGITHWQWIAPIVSAPKGTMTGVILSAKQKIDSLLKTIPAAKETDPLHHIKYVYLADFINNADHKNDSLALFIEFTKPLTNTEDLAIDSLVKRYKPLLLDPLTAQDATKALTEGLFREDISKARIQELFNGLIKEAGAVSTLTAYEMLMGAPYNIDYNAMKGNLPLAQQEEIHQKVKELMDAFNEMQRKKTEPDVVKPVPKVNTTKMSYCDENLAKQKFKVGTFLNSKSGANQIYFVASYDCSLNKYKMGSRTYIAPRKTFFKTNENVGYYRFDFDDIDAGYIHNNYVASSEKITFCGQCGGTGAVYIDQVRTKGGEWEQLNFNVYMYTTGRVVAEGKERKTCPVCFGTGIKQGH